MLLEEREIRREVLIDTHPTRGHPHDGRGGGSQTADARIAVHLLGLTVILVNVTKRSVVPVPA
jgi:hypothetical protein